MKEYSHTILCVDDEENVVRALKRLLRKEDYRILSALTGEEALRILEEEDVHLVICDQRMPGMTGTELLAQVREDYPDVIRMILTGYTDVDSITESVNKGYIYKFLLKPWNDQNLKQEIQRALEQYDLIAANRALHEKVLHQNQELTRINEGLETLVRERTRDLEVQNQALELSHAILEDLPLPIVGVSAEGMIVLINRAARQLKTPEGAMSVGRRLVRYFGGEVSQGVRHVLGDGNRRTVMDTTLEGGSQRVIISPLSGRFRGKGVILALESRELREAEAAARAGEERLGQILEASGIATFVLDHEHRVTHWNRACELLTGVSAASMLGTRRAGEVFYASPRPVLADLVLEGASQTSLEEHYGEAVRPSALLPGAFEGEGFFPLFGKGGRWVFFTAAPLRDAEGRVVGAVETLQDITKRKRAQEALARSEAFHRGLMEALEDMVFQISADGLFTYLNPAFERLTGHRVQAWVGRNFLELVAPEAVPRVRERFRKGLEGRDLPMEELSIVSQGGEKIPVEINVVTLRDKEGNPTGRLGVARDLRDRIGARQERERLERRLRQSEKMEAIGTLAGGIAHDFNNILYAVMGYTELAMDEVAEDHPARGYLREVLQAGKRAKDLVSQILTFSRQGTEEQRPVNLAGVVREAMGLLRASIPSFIEVRQEIHSEALVSADPGQLHQVVMNLCTNAAQAMEEKGGTLTVGLEEVHVDPEPEESPRHGLKPGPTLLLTVQDTGPGIPRQVLERIFEPFFTTKETGKGTGMGLSVVHGIVEGLGGTVTVQSEPGKGALFRVYLPITREEAGEADRGGRKHPPARGDGRQVLFVDDEEPLVELGRRMLSSLGYRVTTRVSSLEALELFRAVPDRFDAVVTDLSMPQMKGDELAREIRKIRPQIPVILCTGFGGQAVRPGNGIRAVVNKPILREDLAEALARVLAEAA